MICILGTLAFSVTARADSTPAPALPAMPNANALRQSMTLTNRMMLLRQRIEELRKEGDKARQMRQMPGFAPPGTPQASAAHPAMPDFRRPALPARHPGGNPLSSGPAHAVPAPAAAVADAAPSGNPYESIVARNVFGLNPIPKTDPNAAPPGPPPPKITVTGITTIFGPAEALFKVEGVIRDGKKQDESYIFTEGEEQDNVEVTKIDVQKAVVTFINNGVQQEIPLANGVATGGSSSEPSFPAKNGPGGFFRRRPDFNNLPPALRERMEQRNGGSFGAFNSGNTGNQNGYSGGFNNYNNTSYNNNPTVNPATGLSAQDQQVLIAAERQQALADHNPMANLLPPTPQLDGQAAATLGTGRSGGAPTPPAP